jgi:hypothetical protein
MNAHGISITNSWEPIFRNFQLQGNKANQDAGTWNGLNIINGSHAVLEGLDIENTKGNCVYSDGATQSSWVLNSRFELSDRTNLNWNGAYSTISGIISDYAHDFGIYVSGTETRVINSIGDGYMASGNGTTFLVIDGIYIKAEGINTYSYKTGISVLKQNVIISASTTRSNSVAGISLKSTGTQVDTITIVNSLVGVVESGSADYNIIQVNAYSTDTGITTIGANSHVHDSWNATTWIG